MSSSKYCCAEGRSMVTSKLISIAKNSRRISRDDDLDGIVSNLVANINAFNMIQPDDHLFSFKDQQVHVSELVIPVELQFLLIPLSIRIDPMDLKTKDIKVIPKYSVSTKAEVSDSLLDFKCLIDNFRRHFKLNGSDNLVKVMDVRKNVSLFDCLDSICAVDDMKNLFESKVHYFRDAFWPTFVRLSSVSNILEDNYFNDNCESLMKDYLFNLHFG